MEDVAKQESDIFSFKKSILRMSKGSQPSPVISSVLELTTLQKLKKRIGTCTGGDQADSECAVGDRAVYGGN